MNAANKSYTIQELRDRNLIIFEAVSGSNAYGTNTPESDTDIRGVFVQPLQDILQYGFVEQVSDEKNDITFYELGRFTDLLIGNNPNILELIAMPEDCIIYKDPYFEMFKIENFLTKRVRWTFAGYAEEQIKKARGYNKKINWEENQMVRKTVLDFCYVLDYSQGLKNGGLIPFNDWLPKGYEIHSNITGQNTHENLNVTQKDFGLSSVDHAKDMYALYYLGNVEGEFGIVSNEEVANDVQLISIPKGISTRQYLFFNKDAYSTHCRRFKEYQEWLTHRNENRFKMNKDHGKNYDSKNMMHTYRLLSMALEMAQGELRVRRTPEEIVKLMKIRRGEYEYEDLLKEAEAMAGSLDQAFKESKILDKVDTQEAYEILLTFRQHYYFDLQSKMKYNAIINKF